MMQVNALKAHGGIGANEAPWLGTWTFVNGVTPDTAEIYLVEGNTINQSGRFAWPIHVPKSLCGTTRYLHWSMVGSSNIEIADPITFLQRHVPVTWHADIQWSRVHGFITSAEFVVNYDGLGEETYYALTLDEATGVYTITDNTAAMTASGHFPGWQTANDLAGGPFGEGHGTITLTENSNEYSYTIPDTASVLGPNVQYMLITLSDRYDISDAFTDAEEMLELIDLANVPTGDSTGTFVPLLWNLEYTVSYAAWPIEAEVLASVYSQSGGICSKGVFSPGGGGVRPNFPPYISKIYGTILQIEGVLTGTTLSGVLRPSRTMQVSTFPATNVDAFALLEAKALLSPPYQQWAYVSKLRAQLNGEPSSLYSLEQDSCSYTQSGIYEEVGDIHLFELSGIESCAGDFTDGSINDLYLFPADCEFTFGVSILYPHCSTTTPPACSVMNALPC